ncbi:MAG: tryptophan synthase subunit alpha [Rikenellaceae bacterium]|nr:tryptophan synthase subunit alpha [Rikenellaceae bacterium]
MNRINKLFEDKKSGILSIYFTAGFPNLNDTVTIIKELENNGVDLIEVGIPFSDPMADGVVIQQSSTVAINNGMSLRLLFDQLKDIRKEVSIPLIMMGYLNPIMQYGIENFCCDCAEVGIDGVIIPDLPFHDYIKDYKPVGDKYGIKFIMLITPETSEDRVRQIDGNTDGFIYMVSTASTTGAKDNFAGSTIKYFNKINEMELGNPRLIGFGISNKNTFDAACKYASGAIIGSHFIKILNNSESPHEAVLSLKKSLV